MILRAAFALNQIIGIGIGFSTPAGCTIIAATASFGITLVTYYLLLCFFGIITLFGIDPFFFTCCYYSNKKLF